MKRILQVSLFLFVFGIAQGQNTWTGSTTGTQTNGVVAIGAALNNNIRLYNFSTSNTITTNFSNYFNNSYTGTMYGIYNDVRSTGTGTKYGIYSYMTNIGSGNRYALYGKIDGPVDDSRAGFFEGDTEVKGNFIVGANNGKFIFTNGWQAGDDFLSIAPNAAGLANTWQWPRGLTFYDSGELAKSVDNAAIRAFSVNLNGTRTFQVMGNGKVYAREVEVSLAAFPDYVFDSKYPLLSLDALRQYIREKKHLPNVPSAATIDQSGIGLGELSIKQVEKIEELTLYLLQLDDRLKKIETENAQLRQEIAGLKSAAAKK